MSEHKAAAQRLYKAFDQHGTSVGGGAWALNFSDPAQRSLRMQGPSQVAPGVSGMVVSGLGWSLKASPSGEVAILTGDAEHFSQALATVEAKCPVLREEVG